MSRRTLLAPVERFVYRKTVPMLELPQQIIDRYFKPIARINWAEGLQFLISNDIAEKPRNLDQIIPMEGIAAESGSLAVLKVMNRYWIVDYHFIALNAASKGMVNIMIWTRNQSIEKYRNRALESYVQISGKFAHAAPLHKIDITARDQIKAIFTAGFHMGLNKGFEHGFGTGFTIGLEKYSDGHLEASPLLRSAAEGRQLTAAALALYWGAYVPGLLHHCAIYNNLPLIKFLDKKKPHNLDKRVAMAIIRTARKHKYWNSTLR